MASFPRNHLSLQDHLHSIKSFFGDRLNLPCYIVGNGPSCVDARLSDDEISNSVIFRANWFFLEEEKRYGNRVDGFFWSVSNKGLKEALVKNQTEGSYDIRAFFQPFKYSESRDRLVDVATELEPSFDHWAVIATNPALARFMMGRPLPTQGMQMIAFAAVLGFKKIHISGIDLYESAASRYAWQVPDHVRTHLKDKDVSVGYEADHDLEVDLHFLRTIRAEYDIELIGISDLKTLAPFLDRFEPRASIAHPSTSPHVGGRSYVTLADGRYTIGAMALARSLAKVTDVPLLVLHSDPHVPRTLAHLPNVTTKLVKKITNHHNPKQGRFAETLTKLRIFDLLEYDRITFIDADCIVMKNIDDLFDRDGFYAAPDWGMDITSDFNSGLLAFTPTAELRNRIFSSLFDHQSSDGGDQGFLNSLLGGEVKRLPPEYNMLKRLPVHHPNLVDLADAKVLHFVGDKPWDIHQRKAEFVALEKLWLSYLEKEDFQHEFWMNKKFIAKRWEKQVTVSKVPVQTIKKEGFQKRLDSYGPGRRTVAMIGDKILPASLAKPIDSFLKKVGIL